MRLAAVVDLSFYELAASGYSRCPPASTDSIDYALQRRWRLWSRIGSRRSEGQVRRRQPGGDALGNVSIEDLLKML
jgi:hypothetical protein